MARHSPFSFDRREFTVVEGTTLSQIVEQAIDTPWLRSWACVAVDGVLVPPAWLPRVRPKAGKRVTITVRDGTSRGGDEAQLWLIPLELPADQQPR